MECAHLMGQIIIQFMHFFWDVEDNFNIIPNLLEVQKITWVKKLIFGATKICVSGNRNLITYSAIKQALIEEFGEKFSSIDLHRQLQKRKLGSSETLFEYFLAMCEIASRGDCFVDDQS